jgi:hypothetical protein
MECVPVVNRQGKEEGMKKKIRTRKEREKQRHERECREGQEEGERFTQRQ